MNKFSKIWVLALLLFGIMTMILVPYGYVASAITPEFAVLQLLQLVKVEKDVVYCSCDIPLMMDIYYPAKTNEPTPAIVYVHGGGWYSGDKETGIGKSDIAPLVSHGYLVAAINYRLAPRYKFPAQIEDVKCAVRFLRGNATKYNIDPDNIGAFGDSAGGHLVSLLGLTANNCLFENCEENREESDAVQAVVDIYGPSDLIQNFENYNSLFLETIFDTTDPNAEILIRGSPVTYVSGDAPPFFIIHGDKDATVLLKQSQILYEKLVSAGVPASLLIVENSDHRFTPIDGAINPTRAEITEKMIDFFDRYLKNSEALPKCQGIS